jgi:replication factor C small subunit
MFNNLFVERYRPATVEDIILSDEDRKYFTDLKSKSEIPNLLFAGPPGTGKTTISKIIVKNILDCQYLYINASDENGIDTIRTKVIGFSQTKSLDGKLKVVFLDECDSITLDAQKALRNVIEEYSTNTRFIFTCNYLFKIIPALQSRCQIFNLNPPLDGVLKRVVHVLKQEGIVVPVEEKPKLIELIRSGYPDIRRVINDVQKYSYSGTLCIKANLVKNLADKVFGMIISNTNVVEIRKFIIEREQEFSSDYLQLLKEMFESIFKADNVEKTTKSSYLLTVSEAMYRDSIVVDKEINWFSCILKLAS